MASWLKWFGGEKGNPPKRVRICVDCGMPVEEHKDWCSIFRARQTTASQTPAQATQQ
jgi:hypothetical protein